MLITIYFIMLAATSTAETWTNSEWMDLTDPPDFDLKLKFDS